VVGVRECAVMAANDVVNIDDRVRAEQRQEKRREVEFESILRPSKMSKALETLEIDSPL
jgi:hypothetical protein